MKNTNHVVKHLLVDLILKARMIEDPKEMDRHVDYSMGKLSRAYHTKSALLTEKQAVDRFQFLTLIKLRNMRARGSGPKYLKFGTSRNGRIYYRVSDIEAWIVANYQLEPFVDPKYK